MRTLTLCLLMLTICVGCNTTTPRPLSGGKTSVSIAQAPKVFVTAQAAEDSKTPAQTQVQTLTIPAGSTVVVEQKPSLIGSIAGAPTPKTTITVSEPTHLVMATTTTGVAQTDTLRRDWIKIAVDKVKLASMGYLIWVGLGVFLLGIFTFTPYAKVTGITVSTSILIVVSGILLMILPVLVVGHEVMILTLCIAAPVVWFIAHRHGQATTIAQAVVKSL